MQHDIKSIVKPRINTMYFPRVHFIKIFSLVVVCCTVTALMSCGNLYSEQQKKVSEQATNDSTVKKDSIEKATSSVLDTALFDQKIIRITNGDSSGRWPVKTVYPDAGAI